MTDKEKIAKILRARRKQRGMTVDSLAEKMKQKGIRVSRATLYRYEKGNSMPNVVTYLRLCELLELDPRAYQRV